MEQFLSSLKRFADRHARLFAICLALVAVPVSLIFLTPVALQLFAPPLNMAAKGDADRAVSKARLLLVEDEAVVGMFMEELLGDMGFAPTGPIASLGEALAAAKKERFDGAVLDMNLKGELVYPLAELLKTQNVPFIFVTGYSRLGVHDRFSGVPIVQKPVTSEALAEVLFSRFGRFVPPPAGQVAVAVNAP